MRTSTESTTETYRRVVPAQRRRITPQEALMLALSALVALAIVALRTQAYWRPWVGW